MFSRSLRANSAIVGVLVLLCVAAAGMTCLPQPFDGDQALFAMGAEQWVNGEIYFRDFWDLKPPGIYLFYAVGGSVFSFDEVGIHLFELCWSIAFALTLVWKARSWVQTPTLRALVPAMTVGIYYCIADTWHLTQVEWIVAFPLFVSSCCMTPAGSDKLPSVRAFFLAGLCGGLIGLFKPMYGLIPAAIWLSALLSNPRPGLREKMIAGITRGIPFTVGVLIPLTALAWYFHYHGVLDVAWKTMFEYPPRVLAQKHDGYGMLVQGLKWGALMAGPLLALGVAGTAFTVRREADAFGRSLVIWLCMGLFLVFIQRMWWEYHYLLVLTPLGLLALKAMDTFVLRLQSLPLNLTARHRIAASLFLILLFSTYPSLLLYRTAVLSGFGFAINADRRLEYQSSRHFEYQTAIAETQFLHDSPSRPGDIQVFGNPIFYRFAQRQQAIPQQGWSIKIYLPEQWAEIEKNLKKSRPIYVFVATNKQEQLAARRPNVLTMFAKEYKMIRQSSHGVWYELVGETPRNVSPGAVSLAASSKSARLAR